MSPVIDLIGSAKGFGWGALTAGSSFESIASAVGTGSSGTITFSSIPSTYKHLQVRFSALANTTGTDPYLRFNGISTTTYDWHHIAGNGSAVSTFGSPGDEGIRLMYGADGGTTYPMSGIIDIHDYASTTKNKTVRLFAGFDTNGAGQVTMNSGLYNSTTAVSSIDIVTDGSGFLTGSTFSLYGIKGA